jgi:membrane-associated phospholipid phosphatase
MKSAGTGVAVALPIVAGGIALAHDWDWTGAAQLAVDTGLTVGTALALKQFVREQRPDHSDFKSFPSDTSALAFAPAAFLWDRYGWEYGVPAYAAAAFVGYSRVDTKEHHWWDVAASAGIAWTYSRFITTEYQRRYGIYSELQASPQGAFVSVDYRF